jgi:nitrate reductase gamma subunit
VRVGALIFASIGTSDTATGALVAYGLTFAVAGVAAVAAGICLLHRRRTPSRSATTPRRSQATVLRGALSEHWT